jgi:23S rRNA (uracil1939-C5)-methyltransferase
MTDAHDLTILNLGQRGEGVAEFEGKKVYVPRTLPGEAVTVSIEGERGTLLALQTPSPERAEPFCPHYGACGGCQLQHLSPQAYAEFKRGLVVTALSHAGLDVTVDALIDARGTGRRRATLHARKAGAGYMGVKSHAVVDIDRCPILVPALNKAPNIARAAWALIGDCDVSLTATISGLDVGIRTEKTAKREKLSGLGQQFKLARLSLNGEMIFQALQPIVPIGKARIELPVGSFLQATDRAETVLAELVVAALAGKKHVADLFCGIGPFTLRIAENHRVYAADSDKPAIAALQKAFRMTQGLKAATVVGRDLFRDPLAPVELKPFDAVVIDPPRAGAEAQMHELAASTVKTVVSISCDPKTFARDAKILVDAGFRLETVTPVDQFAYATHVEVFAVLTR